MQITAHVYADDDANLPAHVDVLPDANLAEIRTRARRLLRRYRQASRVEVRFEGALMLTFLAKARDASGDQAR
jgi:hypothetical protein